MSLKNYLDFKIPIEHEIAHKILFSDGNEGLNSEQLDEEQDTLETCEMHSDSSSKTDYSDLEINACNTNHVMNISA